MTKEALKLGLEALCVAVEPKKGKVYAREFEPIDCFAMHEQAITAIKAALAQTEQEPVAYLKCKPLGKHEIAKILDRERMKWHKSPPTYEFDLAFARAIEAAHGIGGEA